MAVSRTGAPGLAPTTWSHRAGIRNSIHRPAPHHQRGHPLELPLGSVATRHPKFIARNELALKALRMMEDNMITVLPVLDEAMRPVGVLRIHDLIRVGIA